MSLLLALQGAGGATHDVTVAETGAATDSQIGRADFVSANAESGTALESQAAAAVVIAAISESGSAVEIQAATMLLVGSVSEVLGAADTETAQADFAASIAATGNAVETESTQATFVAILTDALTTADSQAGEIAAPPATYDVAVNESLTVTDVCDAAFPQGGVTPSGTYVTFAGKRVLRAVQREQLLAMDRQAAARDTAVVLNDTLDSADAPAVTVDLRVDATDEIKAIDRAAVDALLEALPREILSIDEAADASADFFAPMSETLASADEQWCELVPGFTPSEPWRPNQEITDEEEEAFMAFLMMT